MSCSPFRKEKQQLTIFTAIAELEQTGKFEKMSLESDEEEHRCVLCPFAQAEFSS